MQFLVFPSHWRKLGKGPVRVLACLWGPSNCLCHDLLSPSGVCHQIKGPNATLALSVPCYLPFLSSVPPAPISLPSWLCSRSLCLSTRPLVCLLLLQALAPLPYPINLLIPELLNGMGLPWYPLEAFHIFHNRFPLAGS